MAQATLLGLPEELISNIAGRLGSDGLFALRLGSKALAEKSLHDFATEYFTSKCVHFTTDSLKTLVEISSSRLAKYIKDVSIVTALFSSQGFQCPGRASAHWKPTVRQSEAYKFYMQDQTTLHTTGNDREMLSEAFRSLPSLKIVSLTDSQTSLKAGTDYRGGNKVLRQTGTRPINGLDSMTRIQSSEFRKHLEHLWSTLLIALADAKNHVMLEELHTNFSTDLNFLAPKQFSVKTGMLSQLSGVFETLARLHLHLKTPTETKGYREILSNFASTMPNLQELSLDFDTKQHGSGLLFRRLVSGLDLSKLTSVNLIGLSIDAAHLAKSISRLKNLKDLRLYCVEVSPGTWPLVLKAIGKLEKIDHLHLMYLRESGCKSYFLKQRDPAEMDDPDIMDHVFGETWDDEEDDEDDDDDDDSTDDELPELQPADEDWMPPNMTGESIAPGVQSDAIDDDNMSEYVPGGDLRHFDGERGFYICIEGHEKIMQRLEIFINEYNLGEYMDPADDGFAGMGPFPVGLGGGGMTIPVTNGVGPANMAQPPAAISAAFMTAMGTALGLGPHPNGPAPHGPAPPGPANSAHPPPATAPTVASGIPTTFGAADETGWESDDGVWEDEGAAFVDEMN